MDLQDTSSLAKMHRARTKLLIDEPFYGHLAMNLAVVPIKSLKFMMATDGHHLIFNPEKVLEVPLDKLTSVIEHELTHIILSHHTRRGSREPDRWNQACDYAVNEMLTKAGRDLPDNCLLDPAYYGLTAEQIYGRMPEPSPSEDGQSGPQGSQQGNDPAGGGGQEQGMDSIILDAAEGDEEASEESWEGKMVEAENLAKQAGNMPAALSMEMHELIDPKEDWPQLLRQFMTATARDDYSWARPNRRFISQGLYMPEARSEQMGLMVLAIDVSGSINQPLLDKFLAELGDIFNEVEFEQVHIIAVNTTLQGSQQFTEGEPLDVSWLKGGGGTKFSPAFNYVNDLGLVPDVFVYFTDMLCREELTDPGYPVLWAKAPHEARFDSYLNKSGFGEIIELTT